MADGARITEGVGPLIDTDELLVDGVNRHRQRIQVAGTGGIAEVIGTEPATTADGLVTRAVGVVPVLEDIRTNLQEQNQTFSKISTLNSTETPLAANETFTGAWEEVTSYAAIMAVIFTDAASVTNGAIAQFSADGIDIVHQAAATVPANQPVYFSFPSVARYFRIVYTNGAVAQTALEAQVTYHNTSVQVPLSPMGGQMDDSDVVAQTKSAMYAKVMSGPYAGIYLPPAVTTDGHLSVRTENWPTEYPLPAAQLTTLTPQKDALTDAQLRATAVGVSLPAAQVQTDALTDVELRAAPVAVTVDNHPDHSGVLNDIKRDITDYEERFEFDANGLPLYVGKAPDGTLTSAASWTIYRFTFVNGLPSRKQVRTGVAWDNRAAVAW